MRADPAINTPTKMHSTHKHRNPINTREHHKIDYMNNMMIGSQKSIIVSLRSNQYIIQLQYVRTFTRKERQLSQKLLQR